MADDEVIIRARLIDELSEPANRVENSIDRLADSHRRTARQTDEHAEALRRAREELARNTNEVQDNSAAQAEAERRLRELTDQMNNNNGAQGDLNDIIRRGTKRLKTMSGGLLRTGMRMAMMLGLVSPLATGIGALAAAAVASVAGLTPLVGTLLPMPALLMGVGQGAIAAVLGFKGMGGAISAIMSGNPEDIAKALKDLGPNAASAATSMAELAKSYKPIRQSVQERMWERMADPIKQIGEKYLPIITQGMNLTGTAMNEVLHNLANFMLMNEAQERMGRIMTRNAAITESMGKGGVAAFRALIAITDAAGDVGVRMARDFHMAMDGLSTSIETNSDRIGAFAMRAYVLFGKVKAVIGDFGVALFNVFRASVPLSNSLGASVTKIAAAFRAWTENPENFAKMVGYFDRMKPALSAIWALLVALGKAFVELSDQPFLTQMLDMITGAVPAFVELSIAASKFLIPIVSIGVSLIEIAAALNVFGPISAILWALAGILSVIAAGLNALPEPVQKIIGAMLIWGFAIMKVHSLLKLLGFAGGLKPLLSMIMKLIMWFGKLAIGALMAGGKMALAWLIGLGPIGWIILAIVALIGIFVLLYMKCEWFRNAVQAVWEAIKSGAASVWAWMQSAAEGIGKAWTATVDWIKNAWTSVVSFFSGLWTTISSGAATAVGWIVGVWAGFLGFFSEIWSALGNLFSVGWQFIKDMAAPVVEFIVTVWGGIVGMFQASWNLIIALFQMAWAIIRLIVNVAIFVIGGIIMGLVAAVMWVLNPIIGFFQSAWAWIGNIVGIAVTWIGVQINRIQAFVSMVMGYVTGFFSSAWSVITSIVSSAVSFIGGIINWIGNFVSAAMGIAQSIFAAIWGAIVGHTQGAVSAVGGVINTITGIVSGVMNTVSGIWNSVWGGMQSFVMGIIGAITGALNGIASVVSSITSGISSAASALPGLASGGTVTSGMTAMIGEVGPEAFVSSTGRVTPIGLNGPDIMRFPTSGYVVPNHVLAGHSDASVPGSVMKKLEAATMGGGGGREAAHGGEYLDEPAGGTTQVIIQGDVYGATDLETKIKRAVHEAENSRRRRR